MEINTNSVMIYSLILIVLIMDLISGSPGAILGIPIGFLIIYFLLADDKEKERIRNNLLWRTNERTP